MTCHVMLKIKGKCFLVIETNGNKPKSVEIEREITAVNSIKGDSLLKFVFKITNLSSLVKDRMDLQIYLDTLNHFTFRETDHLPLP